MVISTVNPASRRQASTPSWTRMFSGPMSVRPSISPIAHRWRLSAVLTDDGCELLTRDVPVKVEEIEALMRA